MHKDRVVGHFALVFAGVADGEAGIIVERAVDFLLKMETAEENMLVIVDQADVVDDLKALEALLDRRQHIEHRLLLFVGEVVGVGDGKVVVHMEVYTALGAPDVESLEQGRDAAVFATDGNDTHNMILL